MGREAALDLSLSVTVVTAQASPGFDNQNLEGSSGSRLASLGRCVVKKAMVLFILISAIQLMAVDKIQITVKDASTSNGVVLVTISNAGKAAELQCTESAPFCATPKA